jgi:Putative transposase
VACAKGEVSVWSRRHGEGTGPAPRGVMTVPLEAFIRRYLRHVPVPGTRVVRAYGVYAPTRGADLAICRAQLRQGPVEAPERLDWQTACQGRGDAHPERCSVCGRRLMAIGVLIPSSPPPPTGLPGEAVA